MSASFYRTSTIYLVFVLVLVTSYFSNATENYASSTNEYEIQTDSVSIKTSNGVIFGLLYRPIGIKQDVPAVLCLQGGGDVGLANYTYEAKFFASNGMIALVCDKSGSGLSSTDKSWRQQSFEDKTIEYHQLFTWLCEQPNVDPEKVGLHGMSEGGRLALQMAINYPDEIAFVNSVSGPIESYKKNHLYAIRHRFLSRGSQMAVVDEAVRIWDAYLEEIATGTISSETINKVNAFRRQHREIDYLPSNSTQLPTRPLPQDIHFTQEFAMDKIVCPVLFQFGELDILVDPERSIALIPKDPKFAIKYYTETDHSMNLSNGDVHPNFIPDKKKWIVDILNL